MVNNMLKRIFLMNTKAKRILIALGLVFIFALLVIIYLHTRRVSPIPAGTVGNTAGNANNNGMFCEYNGTVYFSNPYDNGSLYSMKPDGTRIKKLGAALSTSYTVHRL